MERFKFLVKNKIKKLPKRPGVYAFSASAPTKSELRRIRRSSPAASVGGKKGRKFLYIGKAANLKGRVKNHFQQSGYKDNLFMDQVVKIGFIKTDSEIEALLLEAKLIKKYQPKYNVIWRDDKNFFYIGITKENLPKIFITHQPEENLKTINYKLKTIYIGPFVEGRPLKQTLRFLRRIFPYYTAKKHPKNLCSYCHLKLCPGPNPDVKEYKKNIKNLISVLKGKKKSVFQDLKKEMQSVSTLQDFEKAVKIRDQIWALERVFSHTKILKEITSTPEQEWIETQRILQNILQTKKKISRIEAYDVSNIQGKNATGSMVTFINGKADKNFYRKFKIKIAGKPNDIAMLKEVLSRRLQHPEWPFPDVILIDGGKAQLNVAQSTISNQQLTIPAIALAKKKNELYLERRKKPILLKTLPRPIFNLILQLRDEAHRFALTYHRKLRWKALIEY